MLCVLCYEFLSRIASSVLRVNCYQWGSCVGGPSAFNSPFGHRSRSKNICPLDNHLSGLSIYRLSFFKSLVWLGCDSKTHNLPFWWRALYLYTSQSVVGSVGTQNKSNNILKKCIFASVSGVLAIYYLIVWLSRMFVAYKILVHGSKAGYVETLEGESDFCL